MKICEQVKGGRWQVTRTDRTENPVTCHVSRVTCRGFTMVEIAISLAVIGIALVSIIGVLPIGMHTQRDNREETLINQDATILLEAIRGGARGLDDLTNYVFAITNYWTEYAGINVNRRGTNGYTFTASFPAVPFLPLTNGSRIIGLLSTPEYTDLSGVPIPTLNFGGISNHVVAYVRSLSGLAGEKPPQDNDILRTDSFSYRILCVNAPVTADTNLFYLHPFWLAQSYNAGDTVFYNFAYWQATSGTAVGDIPGQSVKWVRLPVYDLVLAANLHEMRLTFFWPLMPNNSLPGDAKHQTFRTLVAGQLVQPAGYANQYFYQPQSFTPAL
jgi:prepilin-type N-terminal cleavage/methylation domain-containing protein